MKLTNMLSIYILMAIAAVTAMDLDPESASLAFKHMNITLAPDAIDILQHHGLWTPSAAALNGLEPMFDDNYNATLENEKFEASGININDLVHLGVIDESSKAVASLDTAGDETGLVDIDVCHPYPSCCDWCHKCEGGCASIIIFFILPWLLCSAACWSQDFCKGCD